MRRFRARLVGLFLALTFVGCASVARAVDYTEPENLAHLIAEQKTHYLLLDVRTPAEFAAGHIPTAVNIPYDRVAGKMAAVDRSALIIVYCASGGRASIAAKTLAGMGFTNVADFGAITSWTGRLVTDGE